MKCIKTEDAVGHVLCHDMTQIIPGVSKGPRFRKGHIVTAEDIPVLLSMGKEQLYVWELQPGFLHENDAAERLCALCQNANMRKSETKEGKIELSSDIDGVFLVDTERLNAVNSIDEIMIATRRGNGIVHPGDKLCGTRVIPLVIKEEKLRQAEQAAGGMPILEVRPFTLKTAAVVTTGSEVAKGRIPDSFTPVVERKLAALGIKMTEHDFTGETAITALLYKEANCISPALYYKSCKICMLSSKGTASEATFASGDKNPNRHAEPDLRHHRR